MLCSANYNMGVGRLILSSTFAAKPGFYKMVLVSILLAVATKTTTQISIAAAMDKSPVASLWLVPVVSSC